MYEISEQVLNATLQYLAGRPFAEVADLINVLRQSKQILEPGKEPKKENDTKRESNNTSQDDSKAKR